MKSARVVGRYGLALHGVGLDWPFRHWSLEKISPQGDQKDHHDRHRHECEHHGTSLFETHDATGLSSDGWGKGPACCMT
jgi:hypothetical protein